VTRRPTALVATVLALAAALALTGCRGSSVGDAANSSGSGSGSNTLERIAEADRKDVLTVSGTTLDGAQLSTAAYRGQVVVLNYWGSWCPPCVKETPDLKAAWEALQGKQVQFLGLDAQEGAQTGAAFMKANGLTYPSLQWDGGKFLLQLKGKAPAPPVTLVLDQEGRLAARVLAPVTTSTLVGLVDDVLAGGSNGSTG
jgi:thiol-disulfide isomerase/thioredoxin